MVWRIPNFSHLKKVKAFRKMFVKHNPVNFRQILYIQSVLSRFQLKMIAWHCFAFYRTHLYLNLIVSNILFILIFYLLICRHFRKLQRFQGILQYFSSCLFGFNQSYLVIIRVAVFISKLIMSSLVIQNHAVKLSLEIQKRYN